MLDSAKVLQKIHPAKIFLLKVVKNSEKVIYYFV